MIHSDQAAAMKMDGLDKLDHPLADVARSPCPLLEC